MRRVTALARGAKVVSVAWSVVADQAHVQSPASAILFLPQLTHKLTESMPLDEVNSVPIVAA